MLKTHAIKLAALKAMGSYSAFTIKAGSGEFKVHKCVLASQSPVFDAVFRNDIQKSRNGVLELYR